MTTTVPQDAYKRWSPTAQEKALEAVRQIAQQEWKPFYCPRPACDGNHHMLTDTPYCGYIGDQPVLHDWVKHRGGWRCERELAEGLCLAEGTPADDWTFRHGRADQHPPRGNWLTWLIRGGRGSGKTRTGSEWTHRRTKVSPRIALVAQTGPDGRDTMVEGESGLLATAPPDMRPTWEPSKKKLTWPNGAQAFVFSAEEPDRLRGPQHYDAWLDEPAHMPLIEEVWSNLLFGLRLGRKPRICCTTTPLPSKWIKELVADPDTISVVASTYTNIHNLAPQFAQVILRKYEGTRKGRQEIRGEILADVEGALWDYEMLHNLTDVDPDAMALVMDRIVVAIDPAGTQRKKSDETGIVVIGVKGEHYYVLHDASGKYSPAGWADRAVGLVERYSADYLVVETNYGGDMVRTTLESSSKTCRIEEVNSRRGKVIRADPVVALYEKGRVHHVGLGLTELEDQLVGWVPGTDSPDRLDALVHGITDLARTVDPTSIAAPGELRLVAAQLAVSQQFDPRAHLSLVRSA